MTRSFRAHEVPVAFGPGRHVASDSVFLYFLDPDGLTQDYSFGMEEFEEQLSREARRILPPGPATLDTWSSDFDSRAFSLAGENEQP